MSAPHCGVGVAVGVLVGVDVAVGVSVGVNVGVAVWVGDGVNVAVGVSVGVDVTVGVGLGTHAGVRLVGIGVKSDVLEGRGTEVRVGPSGVAVSGGGQVPPGHALAVVDGLASCVGPAVGQNHSIVVLMGSGVPGG